MKENSALFMKALVERSIAYKHQSTRNESVYSFDFSVEETSGRVNVSVFNDDNGLRITIDDFFHFDYEYSDAVLDVINTAPERIFATIYTLGDEVIVRKEITTGGGFNPAIVLNTAEELMMCADSIARKLDLLYSVLS